jgi:PAS domain S-box-containing protein
MNTEPRLRAAFEHVDDGLLVAEVVRDAAADRVDLVVREANRAAERLLGMAPLVGRSSIDLRCELGDEWLACWDRVLRTGASERIELNVEKRGLWLECHVTRIEDEASRYGAAMLRDVTAHRRLQESLRASEARQAFLVQLDDRLRNETDPTEIQRVAASALGERLGASRVGYAEDEGDGEHIVVMESYTDGVAPIEGRFRYTEYGSAHLPELRAGRTVARGDVANDGTLEPAQRQAHAAMQVGAMINVPLVKRGRLVAVLFVHFRAKHVWSDDELALLQAVAERTWAAVERARAEAELRRTVERYERQVRLFEGVASTTPDFVYLFDLSGRFLYANRRLLEVWGMQLADVVGKTCRELGYEQWHHDMHMREIAQVIETQRPIKGEVPFEAPLTGIFGVYEYIFTPVLGPRGEVEIIAGTTRDITQRKREEESLLQADRKKDEFLAMLAHELRNPLAPIRMSVGVLQSCEDLDPVVARCRDVIERQSAHMARLLEDLLDVSRLSRGKLVLQRKPLILREAIEAALETSRPLIARHGHRLHVDAAASDVTVDGDAARLTQVFANLLNNAAKYTDPGGRIELSVGRDAGFAVVRVRDHGIGIAPEQLERVFDLFAQSGDAQARAPSGLGIGLSLARRLVEMHGGSIRAESEGLGFGTKVTVRLPTIASTRVEAASDPMERAVLPRRRVLVADDNVDAADTTAAVLATLGCDVRIVYGGEEAVREAERFRPEVVLMDLGMPGVDGYQACRTIRGSAWGPDVVMVAVSGWGQHHDRQRSATAGFDFHYVKPVDPSALEQVLRAERPSARASQ